MVIAETVVFMAIACGQRRKVEDRVIQFTSCTPTRSFTASAMSPSGFTPAKTVEQIVTDTLNAMPQVSEVNIAHENGELQVTVFAQTEDRALRYAVYDKQFWLMESFPEAALDFRLIQAE